MECGDFSQLASVPPLSEVPDSSFLYVAVSPLAFGCFGYLLEVFGCCCFVLVGGRSFQVTHCGLAAGVPPVRALVVTIGLHLHADMSDCIVSSLTPPSIEALYDTIFSLVWLRYDLMSCSCMI